MTTNSHVMAYKATLKFQKTLNENPTMFQKLKVQYIGIKAIALTGSEIITKPKAYVVLQHNVKLVLLKSLVQLVSIFENIIFFGMGHEEKLLKFLHSKISGHMELINVVFPGVRTPTNTFDHLGKFSGPNRTMAIQFYL